MGWSKDHGKSAKVNAEYAKEQGNVAKQEATNLAELKSNVEAATQNASTAVENASAVIEDANTAASNADNAASEAIAQANRAKAEADRLAGTDVSKLDNKIGSLSSLNTTNKTSVVASVNEVTKQLAQKARQSDLTTTNANVALKADRTEVDSKILQIVSGSPKGTYPTLSALQTAYPNGTQGVYLVIENGHWYYWNTGWTDGGVYQSSGTNEFTGTNLITNGDFTNGVTGWIGNGATLTANAGQMNITISALTTSAGAYQQNRAMPTGNKFFLSAEFTPKYKGNVKFGYSDAAVVLENHVIGQKNRLAISGKKTASNSIVFYHDTTQGGYVIGDVFTVDNFLLIDLTTTFGAGNEPTIEEMNKILGKYPNQWFNGTVAPLVDNRELYSKQKITESQILTQQQKIIDIENAITSPSTPSGNTFVDSNGTKYSYNFSAENGNLIFNYEEAL